jgi:hypothetical protein
MILNSEYPLYNTIIVFIIIILFIYLKKPDIVYDDEKKEFRQLEIDKDIKIGSMHILAIIMAIFSYGIFYQFFGSTKEKIIERPTYRYSVVDGSGNYQSNFQPNHLPNFQHFQSNCQPGYQPSYHQQIANLQYQIDQLLKINKQKIN